MKNVQRFRIGNDIPVVWKLTTNGERTSLEGRSLTVTCTDALGYEIPVEWEISGADVVATIPGRSQKAPGLLTLCLVENAGAEDMHTVDVMVVELVAHTWQLGSAPSGGVVLVTANIEASLSVAQIQEVRAIAAAEAAREAAEAERAATATADHAQAVSDHGTATVDHTQALADHSAAESDHGRAGTDHSTATADHAQALADHSAAESDHGRAGTDHSTAAADHAQALADHSTADSDHGRAASDHSTAASDHTQALADQRAAEAAAVAEEARAAAETARVAEYESLAEAIRSAGANAAAAAAAAEAAEATAQALSGTVTQVESNSADIADLKSRVADLEFEQGDYYVEAYEPGSTDAVPMHAYGNKNLLKQFDFILLDTSDNVGAVTHKAGVLQRNNLLRFKDGAWAPAVGITAAQAADAQLALYALSNGTYVQYCAAGEYDAETYVEEVLRPWYAGTLEAFDGPKLFKSDGEGGFTEAHALCPWETTETKYTIGLGAQHRLYVLDNAVGESGKVWKGLFLDKTEWDGIDLTQYALEPTAISPCPVCTINDNGTHKARAFFYLYGGDTNCNGGNGLINSFRMFAPGNRTYPRAYDVNQVSNMNLARANNANVESPVPFAEGGYFALDTFIIAQELLYSRRNPFRAAQFGSGISSNDTCNSETTWRQNGGVRYRKSDATSHSYAPFSSNTPFYYAAGAMRSDWSNTLNQYWPKEQCMESQIVASFISEFGISATTDVASPHYFEVYGGRYYYMNVPESQGLEDGYMNVRLYRELEANGTPWYDAEGNEVTYDIAVILRMSLMGGANLSGDIFAYWGGGCEVVGTCGENTANGTYGHRLDYYLQPDQSQWFHETAITKNDLGRFDFESENAYKHLGQGPNITNGYALQRLPFLPKRSMAGGSISQGECYYTYEYKYWSTVKDQRARLGLRFRGIAPYTVCSPRYWSAYYCASTTSRYYGGSAQARFE